MFGTIIYLQDSIDVQLSFKMGVNVTVYLPVYSWIYRHSISNICDFEVGMLYVSDWDMGVQCDIYVGVIVWSVEAFHNHTHFHPVVLLKSLYVRIIYYVGIAHSVPYLKCEAQDNFDWIVFLIFFTCWI